MRYVKLLLVMCRPVLAPTTVPFCGTGVAEQEVQSNSINKERKLGRQKGCWPETCHYWQGVDNNVL